MTRRLVIASLLIFAVLWLTPRLFPVPPQPRAVPGADSVATSPTVQSPATSTPASPDTLVPRVPTAGPAPAVVTGNLPTTTTTAAETTVVDAGRSRLRFNSIGASLVGVSLDDYESLRPGDTSRVELARPREELLSYRLTVGRDTIPLANIPFTRREVSSSPETPVVEYTAPTPAGELLLRYAVSPDSYVVRVTGEIPNAPPGTTLLVQLPQGLASAEADTSDDQNHFAIAYKRQPGDATGVSFGSLDAGEREVGRGPIAWAVTKSKYFLVAVAAPENGPYFGDVVLTGGPRTSKQATHMTGIVPVPVENGRIAFDIYAGPQEWRRLRALGRDLDTANPYGGFLQGVVQPFATLVMSALLWMHETLDLSYGWVLVLFGVLVRVLTWPLNQSAMRTSLRMQRLQPELAEIQRKYKGEPQRLNEAMMKLYRDHGMSPFSSLAGCMPMLIPMPVLFALFFVFQNTIEFRGVPFLWLPDISLYDPLYILPLMMGLSMFALSWIGLRNAPPNPQAKMMAYVMPVVMTAIFFRFPSGLNLYYTVQNLVTLPQQWMLTRERAKAGIAPVVSPAPPRRRSAT